MKLRNIKIRDRLALSFFTILFLNTVLAVVCISRMQKIQDNLNSIVEHNLHKVVTIGSMRHSVLSITGKIRDLIILKDETARAEARKKMEGELSVYFSTLEELSKLMKDDDEKRRLQAIINAQEAAVPRYDVAIKLAVAGKHEEATARFVHPDMAPLEEALIAAFDDMVRLQRDRAEMASRLATSEYERARFIAIVLALVGLVLGAAIAYTTARHIVRPLQVAIGIAEDVATGKLNVQVVNPWKDEFGTLLNALKHMANSLTTIVVEVRGVTQEIATSSSQIALGNSELSKRSARQSQSVQETAASIEELTTTLQSNSDNTREASRLAEKASEVATYSGYTVDEVMHTMGALNAASAEMLGIVNLIEGIAFQTKILALNASVEAARAGRAGLGFSVVASEVSRLAERATSAASEIKALIDGSVARIVSGTELAKTAGITMKDVVESVANVARIIGDVSRAVNEQSEGIKYINGAMSTVDTAAHQNASLVEDSMALASTMRNYVERLDRSVAAFKI